MRSWVGVISCLAEEATPSRVLSLLLSTIKPCRALKSALFPLAALQALKRKKRYEKQLAQIDGTLSTIEFQREALENANTNTEVLKNMGYAAKAMKAAHDNMYVPLWVGLSAGECCRAVTLLGA